MQIRYLVALCLLPQCGLAGEISTSTSTPSHCTISPPVAPHVVSTESKDADPTNNIIQISSKSSEANLGEEAKFSGDVTFTQGPRKIKADNATFNQKKEQLNADGNLVFQDSMFTVTANSLVARMKNNTATLKGAQYWLHGQQIHGDAKELQITPNNNLFLTDTSFTTCPPSDRSWVLQAKKIKINGDDEWGEIWGAKLKVADIPVFYIPYMTIPVSDKRKSGFLFPKFSTSTTNGVEIATPYYWNIAPEYDLTFTPHYMSSRGLFLKTDFRYLAGESQKGKIDLEYLSKDHLIAGSPDRYLYHFEHQGAIDENWRVLANYTHVSDSNYFNDLPSDVFRATDNQLSRIGELSYFQQNWDASIRVQDIEVLGGHEEPYQIMPQLNFNYFAPSLWHNIDFSLASEITNFNADNKVNGAQSATRVHLEPSLTLPFYAPAGSVVSEVKLYQTNYLQRDIRQSLKTPENLQLSENISRTIPQFRLYGQMNFERNLTLFDKNYRQTFDPQIQYLYVGYEDQSDIGIYDSGFLQDDFYGLFRDRRFSGLDRIANANQVTVGVTNRFYDEQNEEQLKFSIGQIFYFENNKVTIPGQFEAGEQPSFSVLAAEMDAKLYQDFYFDGAIQFDTKESNVKKSEVSLEYRPNVNKLIQLNYRYVPDLINNNVGNTSGAEENISQAGLRTAWPVTDSVYFVGNWYYDLNEKRNIETYTGFQYESCCWALRLSYHYRIKTNFEDSDTPSIEQRPEFEHGFYLNFVIKGLGGSGPIGVSDMLNEGLFNYRKPLYLRN